MDLAGIEHGHAAVDVDVPSPEITPCHRMLLDSIELDSIDHLSSVDIDAHLKLLQGQIIASDELLSSEDVDFLEHVGGSAGFVSDTRTKALYLSALHALKSDKAARERERAKLLKAHRLLGDSVGTLARDVLRLLVLCEPSQDAWLRLNQSINMGILRNQEQKDEAGACYTFQEVVDKVRGKSPKSWRYLTFALSYSGHLLIGSLSFDPSSSQWTTQSETVAASYNEIMQPLDEIVRQSEGDLQEAFESNVCRDDEYRRRWWQRRGDQDSRMDHHLMHVEKQFLSSQRLRQLLFGDEDMPCGNLMAQFDAVSLEQPTEQLRVVDLKEELTEKYHVDVKDLRRLRKAELVELLEAKRNEHRRRPAAPVGDESSYFLILDENLQRFPFESLPCLRNKAVYRIPNLAYAAQALASRASTGVAQVDPTLVSYVVDPEANLSGTRERIQPILEEYSARFGDTWKGCVGEPPNHMADYVGQEGGLLLYFGHGGGQQFLSKSQLQQLDSVASIVLMGCSSGRLESVSRKHTRTTEAIPVYYNVEGTALSYLLAGAPVVVGNLWDVTDRDIDRYATHLLEDLVQGQSMGRAVAAARSVCKLRCMVGASPVCYGLPVTMV